MARLLLVHGDLARGEALAREMEVLGHVVGRAPTTRAAAALTEDGAFDLIVVDQQALGANGVVDLDAISRAQPSTGILILAPDKAIARRRRRVRADRYAARVFTRDELYAKLHAMTVAPPRSLPTRR